MRFVYKVIRNIKIRRNMSSKNNIFKELPKNYGRIVEGKAAIIYPNDSNEVFYNPVQCINRDISILMIKLYIKQRKLEIEEKKKKKPNMEYRGVRILEALSATGLRSLRYIKEIPEHKDDIDSIIVNDLNPKAVESIKQNINYNEVDTNKLIANLDDATAVMFNHRKFKDRFDIIDLDPYGTAVPFLDTAAQAIHNGGLLAVTCTDKAVLCGNNSEKCFAKYGSVPIRGDHCHEQAIRIVLHSIASACARHGKSIEPLISLSIDFYIRVFVRVYDSPLNVKLNASKIGVIYQCVGCDQLGIQHLGKTFIHQKGHRKYTPGSGPPINSNCNICGQIFKIGGPLWLDSLHHKDWLTNALDILKESESKHQFASRDRLYGMLTTAEEELSDVNLFYSLPKLSSNLRCSQPKLHEFDNAIISNGYKLSRSHTEANSIKTNAPIEVLYGILKSFQKYTNFTPKFKDNHPGVEIMKSIPISNIDWDHIKTLPSPIKQISVPRYPANPEKFWGPGTKDRRSNKSIEKLRITNQDKRKKRKHQELEEEKHKN